MSDRFVPEDVIRERFERLVDLQNRISEERNKECLGQEFEVLSEGPSKKRPEVATTRSRTGKLVHVEGLFPAGTFLQARVESAGQHHLVGVSV